MMTTAGNMTWGDRDPRGRGRQNVVELGPLFDKQPPHALEAEMALLGSLVLDWQVVGDVLQILKGADDFYKPAHAAIFETLTELYDQAQSIDMVQLNQRLVDKQLLESVGGLAYLVEMVEAVPSAAEAPRYARIVRDKAILRRLIETTGQVLHECYHSDEAVAELLDRAETSIFELAEKKGDDQASDIGVLLKETFERLERDDGRSVTGHETGYFELDEMTNGLQPGEMVIIAARPSMGKTAFAVNIAEHLAATKQVPVAIFSLEMSKQQLAQRMLCSRSGVDSNKVRRNMLSREDFGKLTLTVGELSEAPLYIDDTAGLTLMGLRAKARRLKQRHDIQAVFIDYLQLMTAPSAGRDGRQNEVSAMSRGVKALARELSVPVVCLSQLNRAAEQREGHRPRMSDLRESGSIEQDADVIMMLHREDYYHRGDEEYEDNNIAEVIVNKQRNGPTGVVKLQFHGPTTRFNNLASGAQAGY
ncbi:MAG: replicative DNA helicase [Planctomycetota bacterium]